MHSRRPIPLYPQPPDPPIQTRGEPLSDESDFPPIRIGEDAQDEPLSDVSEFPPIRIGKEIDSPSPSNKSVPCIREDASAPGSLTRSPTNPRDHLHSGSPPQHLRSLNKGLGQKNVLNTVHTTAQQSNHKLKLPMKRKHLESHRDARRHSKRQCLTFDEDDMNWLKDELRDIKFEIGEIRTSMTEIADHLRGDVDIKLEEIICRIQDL